MKRKTAKKILAASFLELAETKPIDKITIRDITENCGYSPATFYRLFKNKYDLIAWNHAGSVAAIMDQIGVDDYPWKQTLLPEMQTGEGEVQQGINMEADTLHRRNQTMKKTIAFLCGLCAGLSLAMLWLHKGLIAAALKGEKLPEAPEGCPAYQKK